MITSTLTSLNNTSQNVMNVEIFFNVILNHLTSMVIRWERGEVSAAHVGAGRLLLVDKNEIKRKLAHTNQK